MKCLQHNLWKCSGFKSACEENHVKHQVSQTRIKDAEVSTQTEEIFETSEYPCFYCGEIITSSNLATHLSECSELGLLVVNT